MSLTQPLTRPLTQGITRALTAPSTGGGAAPIYPVDDVGGTAPQFAYGAVKLRSAYSGPAMRVVRADTTTLDVGFIGAALDTASLDEFLGAETGHISILYDQSGNGNDATMATDASRPLIESGSASGGPIHVGASRPLILNGHQMTIPAGVAIQRRAGNVFMVLENLYSSGTQTCLIQLGTSTNQSSYFFAANTATARTPQLNPGGSSAWRAQQRALIYEQRLGVSTGTITQGDETYSPAAAADLTMNGGLLGNTGLGGGYTGRFYASCWIGYARVLSAGERTAMKDALNGLFSVTETATRRVIYAGDSITVASTAAASPYSYGFAKMADRASATPYHSYQIGGGGTKLVDQLAIYATHIRPLLSAYADNRIVFLGYGTNDLTSGRTDAQIYADIQSECALIRADGGKVIVATILPATGHDATMTTYRLSVNASVRANWASFADGLCDFAADATMGAAGAQLNATLYPDGLHPSRVGHAYLAPIAAAAINALL